MKKIRMGVVGTNRITDWWLEGAMEDSRFELVAVCSRSMERAAEFAGRYGVSLIFDNPEKMAGSPCVDAVYIATPNSTHCELAVMFMNHGKHVLCEKALASNAEEVKMMIDASRRNGVAFMEAMKTTVTPGFRKVLERKDALGVIRRYVASYCQYSSRYDMLKEGVVLNAFKPELSNGALMDIGVYTIYPMVVLFGKPLTISASALMLSTGVDGQGAGDFGYEGMGGNVIYSKIVDGSVPSEIQGESGSILINGINDCLEVAFKRRGENTVEIWGRAEDKSSYYYEVAEFLDVIESDRIESEINSHEASLVTMEIMDEMRRQIGLSYPADSKS